MKLKLRDTFAVPESKPLTLTGDVDLIFSSKIQMKDIASLTAEFAQNTSKENRERLLRRRQLKLITEGNNGEFYIETDEYLLALTTLLKLSKSITTELVPGNENYLDKKTFTWSLF